MSPLIETQDVGEIRCLRLARPPVNALDPDLCRALIAALGQAFADDVRGVVLAGSPKIFSAGLDVPYLMSLGDQRGALLEAWQAFFGAARLLETRRSISSIPPQSPTSRPCGFRHVCQYGAKCRLVGIGYAGMRCIALGMRASCR